MFSRPLPRQLATFAASNNNSVTAVTLGLIHCQVGLMHQGFVCSSILGIRGNPDANRSADWPVGVPNVEACRLKLLAQIFG